MQVMRTISFAKPAPWRKHGRDNHEHKHVELKILDSIAHSGTTHTGPGYIRRRKRA
jgi:hypothetical protein